jgi:hypothetical protein
MATADLFDRVGDLVKEVGAEKQAAALEKEGMKDPGGAEGPTAHPSKKDDTDESESTHEGEQSADNERVVKETIPASVDATAEATPGNAPTQDEVQLGQGVDAAKPTGEDPSVEGDYKGDKEDPEPSSTDHGGTSHPASGSHGEKYSADQLVGMDDDALYKVAAELGNELTADIANGVFAGSTPKIQKEAMTTKKHCPDCHKDYEGGACGCGYSMKMSADQAAQQGYQEATQAGDPDAMEKLAGEVIAGVVFNAQHNADLVADFLTKEADVLRKQAMERDDEDPTGGGAEGEDHGTERSPEEGGEGGGGEEPADPTEAGGGEGAPAGAEELLAAMAGGGEGGGLDAAGLGAPPIGGGEGLEAGLGGGGEGLEAGLGGGMEGGLPPEAAMGGGLEGGLGGGLEGGLGGGLEGGLEGGPPGELGGMDEAQAAQELGMALMEMGITDPAQLAALIPEQGAKIASAINGFKQSGQFKFEEAKTAGQRRVRDYMKGYVSELLKRSQK